MYGTQRNARERGDAFGRPVVKLNIPLIRKEETRASLKMGVTFEVEADLMQFSTVNLVDVYVRSCLMQHIYDSYWSLRDHG